uniref:Uncharacterized protein n=1 Tax=Chrysotila carterae TaxID=13221 RepID=A0A7S4BET4_CHRCT
MSASLCMRVRGCVDARVRMRVRANACACAKACASALNRARACVRPLAVRAFIIASLSSLSTVWSATVRVHARPLDHRRSQMNEASGCLSSSVSLSSLAAERPVEAMFELPTPVRLDVSTATPLRCACFTEAAFVPPPPGREPKVTVLKSCPAISPRDGMVFHDGCLVVSLSVKSCK